MGEKEREEKIVKQIAVSYLLLRKAIGFLGIAFPFILFLGCLFYTLLFHDKCDYWQSSISCYYHTVMRNAFVGVLWIFGIFLFFYRYDTLDNILTSVAGACAIGISLFPTNVVDCTTCGDIIFCKNEAVGYLHLACAGSFFGILSYISIKLFTRTNQEKPDADKLFRNSIYKFCGWAIVVFMSLSGIYIVLLKLEILNLEKIRLIFCLETGMLWAFGISWIVKGEVELKKLMKRLIQSFVAMFK